MKRFLFLCSLVLSMCLTQAQPPSKILTVNAYMRLAKIGNAYLLQIDTSGTGTGWVSLTSSVFVNNLASNKLDANGSYANPAWLTSIAVTKLTGITGTPNGGKFLRDDWTWQPGSSAPANLTLGTRTATAIPINNDNGTGITLPAATGTQAGAATADMYNKYLESYKSYYLRNAVTPANTFKNLMVLNDSTGVVVGTRYVPENSKVIIDTSSSNDSTKVVVIGVREANFDLKTVAGQSIVGTGDIAISGVSDDYLSLPVLSTPGSFTATAASSSQIDLTWSDISNETNYIIQRTLTPAVGGSWSTINSPAANAVSYSNTGLASSTHYYYRLSGKGDGGTARNSIWAFADATTSAGGGVLRTFYLNFSRQVGYTTTEASSPPWNNTTNSFDSWTTVGAVGKTNMITSTGAASTVSATNPTAMSGIGGIDHNNTADAGVFPDNVIVVVGGFNNGDSYRFTGLDDTKHYKVYVHFNNHNWESRVVYFTVNGIGSTPVGTTPTGSPIPRESGGNSGEGHGTGLANTSLDFVNGVQSSSGILNIVFTNTDGSGVINVSSIVIEESN